MMYILSNVAVSCLEIYDAEYHVFLKVLQYSVAILYIKIYSNVYTRLQAQKHIFQIFRRLDPGYCLKVAARVPLVVVTVV